MNKIEATAIRIQMAIDSLRKDDQGLTTVEYIIILALIAIAAIAAWTTFGSSIQVQAEGSADTIGGLPR
jgi:Flp pilus assembly pilin Flp